MFKLIQENLIVSCRPTFLSFFTFENKRARAIKKPKVVFSQTRYAGLNRSPTQGACLRKQAIATNQPIMDAETGRFLQPRRFRHETYKKCRFVCWTTSRPCSPARPYKFIVLLSLLSIGNCLLLIKFRNPRYAAACRLSSLI